MCYACPRSKDCRLPGVGVHGATPRAHMLCGLRRNHGSTDRAVLKFDLDADLSSAFHWNVKQLFVFVTAEYRSKTNVGSLLLRRSGHASLTGIYPSQSLNQVVIWDYIARTPEDAVIKRKDEYNKYALVDQGSDLRYCCTLAGATFAS